ncbi:MAG: Fe-S cluster assembly protein SufD [Acidimicrobiales bacterium]
MSAVDTELLDRLIPAVGPIDPPSLRATNWLLTHGLPDAHDEAWRYSPIDEIISRLAAVTPAQPRATARADLDRLAGNHGAVRLVLVNGVYAPALSDVEAGTDGIRFGHVPDLPSDTASTPLPVDGAFTDGFQALNRAAGRDVTVVVIEAAFEQSRAGDGREPVHIVHVAVPGTGPEISHPRTVIEVGDGQQLHLIETFTGLPGPAMTNACTIIRVGRHAALTHQRIQTEASGATHLGRTQVSLATASRYEASSLMLGADIARHATDVTLHEPGAHVALTGLYRPAGHQRHDTAVRVDHAASRGSSTQEFKGVIDDHARGSFSGHIIVRPDTVANGAHQTNRNLVLQPTAQADSRPWLEIFADDVRCTHGATVGRLDDDALFYLRSRGISLDESRTMLIDAFVREVTDAIEPASLRDHIASLADVATRERQP